MNASERVSVDNVGNEVFGSFNSISISADGRYVAYATDANSLVASDTAAAGYICL
ncbi:MAG: hypothetical protein R3B55_03005 [Candidatus Paceibacterota bacterium]